MWVDTWPKQNDWLPDNYDPRTDSGWATNEFDFMARFFINRHGKAINLSYADAHVSTVSLADLWNQRWHQLFQPQGQVVLP